MARIKEFAADARAFGLRTAWQAGARQNGGGILSLDVPGVGKVAIRRGNSDLAVLRQIFRAREYAVTNKAIENRIAEKYRSMIAAGKTPVIIDAGANVGCASLWFNAEYPGAEIVAIEPDPGNVEMLRRNVAGRKNITVMAAAIGASEGFVSINRPRQSWGYRTERAEAGCPIVTMQQAVAVVANGVPFIMKIDIEGFERDLFAANLGWIDDAFAIYIEPHDWMMPGQYTSGNFQKAMGQRQFELFVIGENLLYVRLP